MQPLLPGQTWTWHDYNNYRNQSNNLDFVIGFDSSEATQASANWSNRPLFDRPFPYTSSMDIVDQLLNPNGINVVRKLAPCIGGLYLDGNLLGAAVAIGKNCVLIPRHCIEDINIKDLIYFKNGMKMSCACVVEEDTKLDYAVLYVPYLPSDVKYSQITDNPNNDDGLLLFHRKGGKALGVSAGNWRSEGPYSIVDDLRVVNHDTDHGSCGGVYVDSSGSICAIHLGIDVTSEGYSFSANMYNLGRPERYVLPIQSIIQKNPNGYLAILLNDPDFEPRAEYLQQCSTYLAASDIVHWTREGRESQLELTRQLRVRGVNQQTNPILFTQAGIVSFQTRTKVNNLENNFLNEFQIVLDWSLGIGGLHEDTLKYSINGRIESDHPLPWDVWRNATLNRNMYSVYQNGTARTGRKGEDKMPAITIPYADHRNLMTTGSHLTKVQFRQRLVGYCNRGRADLALKEVIKDYKQNGLLGPNADQKYINGWGDMLLWFEHYGIIRRSQKATLNNMLALP